MKQYSDRRRARDRDYEAARQACLRRARGMCQVNALGCSWSADQVHHIAGRVGPDPHRLSNLLACCMECHTYVHAHPAWSRERGFMRSRLGQVTPPRWAQEDAS